MMRKVKVVIKPQQKNGFHAWKGYVECEEGVRMGTVWDFTTTVCRWEETGMCEMKWNSALLPGMDKGTVELHMGIRRQPARLSLLRRMMGVLGVKRRPVETRVVELGNRVETEGNEEGEREVLEICLSEYVTGEGRDRYDRPRSRLGVDFKSEGYEMVEMKFGELVKMPDPFNAAAF